MEDTNSSSYYLLRWSDHISNYADMFLTLREEEEFLDCSIACYDGIVGAHRVVLAGCSPYLRDLLKHANNPHPIIFLVEIPRKTVLLLMEFIYRGQAHIPHSQLRQLVSLGKAMKVKGLSQIHLPDNFDPLLPHVPRLHGYPDLNDTDRNFGEHHGFRGVNRVRPSGSITEISSPTTQKRPLNHSESLDILRDCETDVDDFDKSESKISRASDGCGSDRIATKTVPVSEKQKLPVESSKNSSESSLRTSDTSVGNVSHNRPTRDKSMGTPTNSLSEKSKAKVSVAEPNSRAVLEKQKDKDSENMSRSTSDISRHTTDISKRTSDISRSNSDMSRNNSDSGSNYIPRPKSKQTLDFDKLSSSSVETRNTYLKKSISAQPKIGSPQKKVPTQIKNTKGRTDSPKVSKKRKKTIPEVKALTSKKKVVKAKPKGKGTVYKTKASDSKAFKYWFESKKIQQIIGAHASKYGIEAAQRYGKKKYGVKMQNKTVSKACLIYNSTLHHKKTQLEKKQSKVTKVKKKVSKASKK